MLKQFICGALSACLAIGSVACTNDRAMVRPSSSQVVGKVQVGDEVRIHAKNGNTYAVEIIEVGPNYLRGEDPESGKRYRIPMSQIDVMEYEELSGGQTALATVGGLYLAAVAAAVIMFYAVVGSDFGDSWDGGGGC